MNAQPRGVRTLSTNGGIGPTRTAIGTWSGGRYMHYGEPIDERRFRALVTPDARIQTVITADVYGNGEADVQLGKALATAFDDRESGISRRQVCVVGAVGHDFYAGERAGAKGFPRFTDPAIRGADQYAGYLRMATERSLERCGLDSFDVLLLHNPDRTGYTSEQVWEGMRALQEQGLTRALGIAPGPANGYTLDLIDCLERFGEVIDWAMIILNPLEPWPGEFCLDAAASRQVGVIARVVDYGGLLYDDLLPGQPLGRYDHRSFRPDGWVEAGRERMAPMRAIAERTGLTMLQLACQWDLAHPAVHTVVPTLVQEAGPHARPVEDKRVELASLPAEQRLTEADVDQLRALGDNRGSMALRGASPDFAGEERADGWAISEHLAEVARRWSIAPERDLVQV